MWSLMRKEASHVVVSSSGLDNGKVGLANFDAIGPGVCTYALICPKGDKSSAKG